MQALKNTLIQIFIGVDSLADVSDRFNGENRIRVAWYSCSIGYPICVGIFIFLLIGLQFASESYLFWLVARLE
jgi:hypothetical protein